MSARFVKFLVLAAAFAGLSACSTTSPDKCPLASSLVDTASLTQLRSAQDQRPVYTVQVGTVDSECTVEKSEHKVDTSLTITFTATRPSGDGPETYDAPYFVAVTLGNRIITKRVYTAQVSFDSGQTSTTFTESRDAPDIHLDKGKRAYDYAVLVGFQLTKEQLEYNRTVGRYPK